MKRHLIAAATIAAIAVPASGQSLLNQLIQQIGKKKATPQGGNPSAGSGGGGRFTASITPAQTATIDKLLAQPLQDPAIAADRNATLPLIRLLVATGSCAQSNAAWNSVNRFHLTPTNWGTSRDFVILPTLSYHDQSLCLDVARIVGWKKPAANALTFTTYYIAADSGQAGNQTYDLQKASDGQWMIRGIGMGYN